MIKIPVKKMALIALLAAFTTMATLLLRIPFARGYFNLGEIIIFTAALTFGPMVGGIAGAIGAALADIIVGYAVPWAPITFVLKGIEGFVAGKLGHKKSLQRKIFAILVGGLAIIIGYPLVSYILYGWAYFVTELYVDIIQVAVGGLIAIPLSVQLKLKLVEEMMKDENR